MSVRGTALIEALGSAPLREQVTRLLVCPRCHAPLGVGEADDVAVRCQNAACGFAGVLANGVVALGDRAATSFFDDRHEVMTTGNQGEGIRCLCYEGQAAVVEPLLRPGSIVLDVGCGPTLPYEKPADVFVIGLDASYESIRANRHVDMRVYGSATEAPLPDHSVDVVLAYYAVHHMTGLTMDENRRSLLQVFREFARVVKPGGELVVCEVSPWPAIWLGEKLFWSTARSILGRKLDMCFYPAHIYEAVGRAALPGAQFSRQAFGTSMLSTFPPVFSLPWLQIPRFLYPFDVNLYRWRVPAPRGS